MSKFRKKPVVIEAEQWWQDWDNVVEQHTGIALPEGQKICGHCDDKIGHHGWINTLEGGHIVCPGDWIITGIAGEKYPCKPDIFEATYDAVE